MKRKINCLCENQFEIDIPEEWNLEENKAILQQIIDGDFLNYTCNECKKVLKLEFPVRLTDKSKGIDLFLIPELDRNSYLAGTYAVPDVQRVVIGYHELAEKVKLIWNNLNDTAVELIKYQLLLKASKSVNKEVTIYFNGIENDLLHFAIYGLKENEVGITKIPREFYLEMETKSKELASEDPYIIFLTPPYISIKKISLDESGAQHETD